MFLVSKFYKFIKVILVDAINKLTYGINAPLSYQLVWIKPQDIKLSTKYFIPSATKVLESGHDIDQKDFLKLREKFISNGDWDKDVTPIADCSIISRAVEHYTSGVSWEKVGELNWFYNRISELGVQDNCCSEIDVKERVKRLDSLFLSIEKNGQVFERSRISQLSFRESGGIGIGIDRNGEFIWISDGAHRLSSALVLNIKYIPVCLLIVHEEAVINRCYSKNFQTIKTHQ